MHFRLSHNVSVSVNDNNGIYHCELVFHGIPVKDCSCKHALFYSYGSQLVDIAATSLGHNQNLHDDLRQT